MMRLALLALALAVPASAGAAQTAPPTKVGQCAATTIKEISSRLEGLSVEQSGYTVFFTNGISQVTYQGDNANAAIAPSRVDDKVTLCLTSIPKHCPPGDDRGKFYKVTNSRTHKSWEAPDSEHMCGGA